MSDIDVMRTPAQFFFELGFGACWAQATVDNGLKPPFDMSDELLAQQWEISPAAHPDQDELARNLAATDTSALALLAHVANAANAVGWQAGVGGCETAGAIISLLAAHPEKLPIFMAGGFLDLVEDMRDFHLQGALTWVGADGKIWSPEKAREALAAREAAKAEQAAPAPVASDKPDWALA